MNNESKTEITRVITEHDPASIDMKATANMGVALTADDTFVRDAAMRIRVRVSRTNNDLIEIGRDLIAVKAKIGHGGFLKWINTEFGWSDRTALSLSCRLRKRMETNPKLFRI